MTDMETKKKTNEMRMDIETKIGKMFDYAFDVSGDKCFLAGEHHYFLISALAWANALVIEHAQSAEEAKKDVFEDGDLFYIDEYADSNELFVAMLKEIKEN